MNLSLEINLHLQATAAILRSRNVWQAFTLTTSFEFSGMSTSIPNVTWKKKSILWRKKSYRIIALCWSGVLRSFHWLVCNDQLSLLILNADQKGIDNIFFFPFSFMQNYTVTKCDFFFLQVSNYNKLYKRWTLNGASKRERNFCCRHKTRRKHIVNSNWLWLWLWLLERNSHT